MSSIAIAFSYNKYELVEIALDSVQNDAGMKREKIVALKDRCQPRYNLLFQTPYDQKVRTIDVKCDDAVVIFNEVKHTHVSKNFGTNAIQEKNIKTISVDSESQTGNNDSFSVTALSGGSPQPQRTPPPLIALPQVVRLWRDFIVALPPSPVPQFIALHQLCLSPAAAPTVN